ncbi:MAG: type II toxin-antitoxin system Phd/YefM family antitoxin [Thermoleophilaceae bacterium]|jgi:prevent-host-death family protein
MASTVGVRELRQNLSRYLEQVKLGEAFVVTERGREVARLLPSGPGVDPYARLAEEFGATVPTARLADVAGHSTASGAPSGTTDAYLAETRRGRR